MNDVLRCALGMFGAIAPFGALAAVMVQRARTEVADTDFARAGALAGVAAFVCLAIAAVLADPLLDWLDVSAESFQFAAGAAMTPLAMRLIIAGDSMYLPDRLPRLAWLVPLGVPLLAGPVAIIAAITYAGRFGEVEAVGAAALVLAFTAALLIAAPRLERVPLIYVATVARLSGGLILVMAVELAYDGVHSV